MPEDTTFIQRSKDKLSEHRGKVAAGGVSAATLVACYSIFVSQSNFNARMQEEKEQRSVMWRQMQDLDNKLDQTRMEVFRLSGRMWSTNQ